MQIVNTTERLLHPVYFIQGTDAEGKGRNEVACLKDTDGQAGVLPGAHEIDERSIKILQAHRTNMIFFEEIDGRPPQLQFKEGTPPKNEEATDEGPRVMRCSEIAIFQAEQAA